MESHCNFVTVCVCVCVTNCCLAGNSVEAQTEAVAYHITVSLNCVLEAVTEILWSLAWSNTPYESHIGQGQVQGGQVSCVSGRIRIQ
jgi:hypothetical protein